MLRKMKWKIAYKYPFCASLEFFKDRRRRRSCVFQQGKEMDDSKDDTLTSEKE